MLKRRFPELSANHRRGISATLQVLDEALCEFEQWARGRQARSVLYEERNGLSQEQRDRILAEVDAIRGKLARLRDDLGLEVTRRTAAGDIRSQCSALWEHLVELEARRLRRYGQVPPGLADYLDPAVAELIDGLKRISGIARGNADEPAGSRRKGSDVAT